MTYSVLLIYWAYLLRPLGDGYRTFNRNPNILRDKMLHLTY